MNKRVLWILFIYLHQVCAVGPPPHPPDLQGSYCAARTNDKCCTGRKDDCSAPILGTFCYCDDFCNRTRNDDCCPDFWTFCKGYETPPISNFLRFCEHEGVQYPENTTIRINCKECACRGLGFDSSDARFDCDNTVCLIDEDLLNRVKRNYEVFGWKPANYSAFWGRSYDDGINLRLGTIEPDRQQVMEMQSVNQIFDSRTIPSSFNATDKWPGMISRPKDQGWCGSSWIWSTVSVASDRFAIMTYGNDQTFLAPQQLLDCVRNELACRGGELTRAWTFIRKFGLVPDSCYPWVGGQSECKIQGRKKRQIVACPVNPQDRQELHRVGPAYRLGTEIGIQYEIMQSGPVQATMRVTKEFFIYKSGVFRCENLSLSSNNRPVYHSVRITGWGEEEQNNQRIKYWIVANSWGEWWGEKGFFKIQRGVNACGIEDFVIAVWANIEDMKLFTNTIRQSPYRFN